MLRFATLVLFSFFSLSLCGTFNQGFPPMMNVKSNFDLSGTDELTDTWAVRVQEGANIHHVAEAHGYEHHKTHKSMENVHLLKEHPHRSRSNLPHLNSSEHVNWVEQQVRRERFRRSAFFSDPEFSKQWHLNDDEGKDMNVRGAWEMGYQGAGCQVGMVDDGLQWHNPDLNAHYDPIGSHDFNYDDDDPDSDRPADTHGTSAAGCAVAISNNICGVGTAPKAGLAGIRLISKAATDYEESEALSFHYERNDIFSNSWGPEDNGMTLEGPGSLLTQAFSDAIQNGRQGKGSIYLWAGGNGKIHGDNGNYDGYANKPFTLSVGAYDYDDKTAFYSEPCSCLFATAPGGGRVGFITTTSLHSNEDYCTHKFGGTSAAAPMVSGVVCLLLEANPNLGWRDVQHIVVGSATPIDTRGDWQVNGAGLQFSHDYGFGRIDATRMVRMALDWVNMPPSCYFDTTRIFPRQSVSGGESTILEFDVTNDFTIEHFMIYFNVQIGRRGDLILTATSPFGTVSKLLHRHNDRHANMDWSTSSNAAWGESPRGTWKVEFTNAGQQDMFIESYQAVIDGYLD